MAAPRPQEGGGQRDGRPRAPAHVVEAALNHVSRAKAGVAGIYNVEAYASERRDTLERWTDHVLSIVAPRNYCT